MKLSLVIPAYNEADCVGPTVERFVAAFRAEGTDLEVLVVNDHSRDNTATVLKALAERLPEVRYIDNPYPNGFGFAVRAGLEKFQGDAVAIVMADASDSPEDAVRFFVKLREGYDCVFGSRFIKGGHAIDYPIVKLFLNRVFNTAVRLLFGIKYNDTTNAFKMYRRETIDGLKPFLSPHFNLTVELPLKAITRRYTYAVLPNSWTNRKTGISKLKIREMGSRYLFILLYCLIEKWFSLGDYVKKKPVSEKEVSL